MFFFNYLHGQGQESFVDDEDAASMYIEQLAVVHQQTQHCGVVIARATTGDVTDDSPPVDVIDTHHTRLPHRYEICRRKGGVDSIEYNINTITHI